MVRPGDGYSRINASKKSLICLNNYIKSCLETVEDKFGVDERRNGNCKGRWRLLG
jgi:hypothetical protein